MTLCIIIMKLIDFFKKIMCNNFISKNNRILIIDTKPWYGFLKNKTILFKSLGRDIIRFIFFLSGLILEMINTVSIFLLGALNISKRRGLAF